MASIGAAAARTPSPPPSAQQSSTADNRKSGNDKMKHEASVDVATLFRETIERALTPSGDTKEASNKPTSKVNSKKGTSRHTQLIYPVAHHPVMPYGPYTPMNTPMGMVPSLYQTRSVATQSSNNANLADMNLGPSMLEESGAGAAANRKRRESKDSNVSTKTVLSNATANSAVDACVNTSFETAGSQENGINGNNARSDTPSMGLTSPPPQNMGGSRGGGYYPPPPPHAYHMYPPPPHMAPGGFYPYGPPPPHVQAPNGPPVMFADPATGKMRPQQPQPQYPALPHGYPFPPPHHSLPHGGPYGYTHGPPPPHHPYAHHPAHYYYHQNPHAPQYMRPLPPHHHHPAYPSPGGAGGLHGPHGPYFGPPGAAPLPNTPYAMGAKGPPSYKGGYFPMTPGGFSNGRPNSASTTHSIERGIERMSLGKDGSDPEALFVMSQMQACVDTATKQARGQVPAKGNPNKELSAKAHEFTPHTQPTQAQNRRQQMRGQYTVPFGNRPNSRSQLSPAMLPAESARKTPSMRDIQNLEKSAQQAHPERTKNFDPKNSNPASVARYNHANAAPRPRYRQGVGRRGDRYSQFTPRNQNVDWIVGAPHSNEAYMRAQQITFPQTANGMVSRNMTYAQRMQGPPPNIDRRGGHGPPPTNQPPMLNPALTKASYQNPNTPKQFPPLPQNFGPPPPMPPPSYGGGYPQSYASPDFGPSPVLRSQSPGMMLPQRQVFGDLSNREFPGAYMNQDPLSYSDAVIPRHKENRAKTPRSGRRRGMENEQRRHRRTPNRRSDDLDSDYEEETRRNTRRNSVKGTRDSDTRRRRANNNAATNTERGSASTPASRAITPRSYALDARGSAKKSSAAKKNKQQQRRAQDLASPLPPLQNLPEEFASGYHTYTQNDNRNIAGGANKHKRVKSGGDISLRNHHMPAGGGGGGRTDRERDRERDRARENRTHRSGERKTTQRAAPLRVHHKDFGQMDISIKEQKSPRPGASDICTYFLEKGNCRWGLHCKFRHVDAEDFDYYEHEENHQRNRSHRDRRFQTKPKMPSTFRTAAQDHRRPENDQHAQNAQRARNAQNAQRAQNTATPTNRDRGQTANCKKGESNLMICGRNIWQAHKQQYQPQPQPQARGGGARSHNSFRPLSAQSSYSSNSESAMEPRKSDDSPRVRSTQEVLAPARLEKNSERKDEVCRFFGTDKECWAGSKCPFMHSAGPAKTPALTTIKATASPRTRASPKASTQQTRPRLAPTLSKFTALKKQKSPNIGTVVVAPNEAAPRNINRARNRIAAGPSKTSAFTRIAPPKQQSKAPVKARLGPPPAPLKNAGGNVSDDQGQVSGVESAPEASKTAVSAGGDTSSATRKIISESGFMHSAKEVENFVDKLKSEVSYKQAEPTAKGSSSPGGPQRVKLSPRERGPAVHGPAVVA